MVCGVPLQLGHDALVAAAAGQVDGKPGTAAPARVGGQAGALLVRAELEQRAHDSGVPVDGGAEQRCHATPLYRVDGHAPRSRHLHLALRLARVCALAQVAHTRLKDKHRHLCV